MFTTNIQMPAITEAITEKQKAVKAAIEKLNDLYSKKASMQDVKLAEEAANADVKELNKAIVSAWLSELKEKDTLEAVNSYIDNVGEIGGWKLTKPSKKQSEYGVEAGYIFVPFENFNQQIKCASVSSWAMLMGRLLDNCGKWHSCDKHGGLNAKTIAMVNGGQIDPEHRSAFTTFSKKAMINQMQIVAKAMLPEGAEIKFLTHDINYLLAVCQKGVMGKKAGVELVKEQVFCRAFISAMYIRKNQLAYTVSSKAAIHKVNK